MAAVDSLIRLIAAQNADSLVLASDEVPRLGRAGAVRPLSMPPIGAALMEVFVGEVLSPSQIEEARRAGTLTVEHGDFMALVQRRGAGWEMSFKKRAPRSGSERGPSAGTAATQTAPAAPAGPASASAAPAGPTAKAVGPAPRAAGATTRGAGQAAPAAGRANRAVSHAPYPVGPTTHGASPTTHGASQARGTSQANGAGHANHATDHTTHDAAAHDAGHATHAASQPNHAAATHAAGHATHTAASQPNHAAGEANHAAGHAPRHAPGSAPPHSAGPVSHAADSAAAYGGPAATPFAGSAATLDGPAATHDPTATSHMAHPAPGRPLGSPAALRAGWPALPPGGAMPGPAAGSGSEVLDDWLRSALVERASDLIVSAEIGARLRVPGGLLDLPDETLSESELLSLLEPRLTPVHHAALATHGSADFAFAWRDPAGGLEGRFRVNLFRQRSGLAAVFRPVRRHPPTLTELNLPASLARLARYPNGLVLVTGPAGAGKSTTLVALVEQINQELPRHIVTLEDPIEYEYTSDRSLVHQRELGFHVDTFEAGLRAALREAPDVILLGEMRDRPTISAAMTAAETGHLVMSSLHAGGAAMAIDRVIDAFPEYQQRQVRGQLSSVLRAILTQHLLPCRTPGTWAPAIELTIVTPAVATLIRDGKTHQLASAIQTGRDDGMVPLERSLADLVQSGAVAFDTAAAATFDGGAQLRELLGPVARGRAPRH